ncbi:hypothetical protein KIPB_011728, partial [Kipferlia bialata]|eukprot:g11728.t1
MRVAILSVLCLVALAMAEKYTYTAPTGTFSVDQAHYVDNMYDMFVIDTYDYMYQFKIECNGYIESNYDELRVYYAWC